jgi:predicted MFS family arabinose efflux permease
MAFNLQSAIALGGTMAVRYMQRLRKLSPTIALYFVTIALVGFAIDGGVYAVLLNLFLLRLGYGPEAIGLINAVGTLTFALSSLPAGLLGVPDSQPAPYRYALIIAGLALVPAVLAIRAAPNVTVRREEVGASAAFAPPATRAIFGLLALIALVRLFQVAGVAATTTFFNVYLDTELLVPTAQIGAIIAVGRLLGVPAALTTTALTARFGNRAVAIVASLGTAISMLPLALIPHWGAAGLSFIGVIGCSWIRYAASLVYFLELVPPTRRATVSGVTEMAAGICFTVLAFGGGYVIALLGYRSLFLAGAVIAGQGSLLFWLLFRKRNVAPGLDRG